MNITSGSSESEKRHGDLTNATIVSRDDLSGVIKHVLKITGPHFTDAERSRLALVGDLSDLVGYGDWIVAGIGCPIFQAGIPRSCSDAELFSQHFDGVIFDLLRVYGQSRKEAQTPQVLAIR